MRMPPARRKSAGYVLMEALIALLIVSVGLLAISKLEGLTVSAAGEARSRSEAVTLAQKKLEQLRNWVTQASFTAGMVTGNSSYSGTNADYTYAWTISSVASGTLVKLTTTWTDRFGIDQKIDLNSLVTWDNPLNQAKADNGFKGISAPAPSGDAIRGDYSVRHIDGSDGQVSNQSGPGNVKVLQNTNTGRTELLNGNNQVVLYLDKVNGTYQDFSTISGRIYFDQSATLPSSTQVRVRLSSEGECFYDNSASTFNQNAVSGTPSYKYFEYKCYVGSGWYGNVGIKIDDAYNGNAPTICVGDPGFNGGVSNNTLTSAHPDTSATRSYRGFTGTLTNGACTSTTVNGSTTNSCLSTGIEQGRNMPNDGTVVPGTYTSASGANGAYNQHFLLTRLTGNKTCNSQMATSEFSNNAGKYYCISPDDDTTHNDLCPNVWPGFTVATGGGAINYNLTLNMSGSVGIVTSSPTGVSCTYDPSDATSCSTQIVAFPSGSTITLTPTVPTGTTTSTFGGWSGACAGTVPATGPCTVTMSGNLTVGAQFNAIATTHTLSVSIPSGGGTVTSMTGGSADNLINCPTTCSYAYDTSYSSVTLHATANTGYTFTGWSGGGCTGTSDCTVSMTSAQSVSATFAALPVTYTLDISKTGTGSGTVTATYSTGSFSCGATCSASITSGTVVTLSYSTNTGSTFTEWSGTGVVCSETTGSGNNATQSNTQSTCTITMSTAKAVTASFYLNPCVTTISGSRKATASTISVTSPNSCTSSTCSCTNDTSGLGYSCSVEAAPNGTIKLKDSQVSGSATTITANCRTNTNVNFQ